MAATEQGQYLLIVRSRSIKQEQSKKANMTFLSVFLLFFPYLSTAHLIQIERRLFSLIVKKLKILFEQN